MLFHRVIFSRQISTRHSPCPWPCKTPPSVSTRWNWAWKSASTKWANSMCPRCPAISAGAFVEAALEVLWRSPPWSPTWPLSWPVPMAAWSTCWTRAVASGPSHCPTSSGWSIIWPTCWRSCWRWNWTFAMSWRPPQTGWQRCALWTMCTMDSRYSNERFRRWDCHRKIRFKFCDLRFSPD